MRRGQRSAARPLPAAPRSCSPRSVALAGCGGLQNPLGGDDAPSAAGRGAGGRRTSQPDSRGVITYATYQVAVARDGDTLATVASRVGTTTDELARRNALPEDYMLRPGEVLLLPDSVPRPAAGLDAGAIGTQPLGGATGAVDGGGAGRQSVPERPDRPADRPGAPPRRGGRDRLLDRPALRRLGDRARLVERPRPRPRGAREPGAPDPDRQRRQPHLERAADTQPGQGTPVDAAAERRGAAAGRTSPRRSSRSRRTSARSAPRRAAG